MRLVYRVLFLLSFALMSPFYVLHMIRRGGWREGFGQRFGYYSPRIRQELTNRHIVWMHAVSVGEVNLLHSLIERIEHRLPQMKIVATTTTTTGMAELRRRLPGTVTKLYFPLDFNGSINRAIRVMNPQSVVLVEAEIWPNFLWRMKDRSVPVFLVNARISQRSLSRYRLLPSIFRPIFRAFAGVGVQAPEDAQRLESIGVAKDRIHVLGNMKFDASAVAQARQPVNVPAILGKLGVERGAPILIGGSTHAGEEEILVRIAERLRRQFPNLVLILVPRHHERTNEVRRMLDQNKVRYAVRSEILGLTDAKAHGSTCLLVDTMGELRYFYGAATVVFIGKSLTTEGGQNPIEPGSLSKPIVFGPNMQNFTAIADALVEGGGAIRVKDEAELEQETARLLSDAAHRTKVGEAALSVIRARQGGLDGTVDFLLREFKARGEHVIGLN